MTVSSALEMKGLPCNLDAERFVLGSILMDDSQFDAAAGLELDDFSLEKHRRIFRRMADLRIRGEHIDRVTVAEELRKHSELESCDGLSYLVSLDDGLPRIFNLDSYVRIVKEKSVLRRIIFTSQRLANRCLVGEEDTEQILADAQTEFRDVGQAACSREDMRSPMAIVEAAGGLDEFLKPPALGIQTPWPAFNKRTFGLQRRKLILLGGRPSSGKSTVALNIAMHAVLRGIHAQFFSLEMGDELLVERLICMAAGVRFDDFKSGEITSDERGRMREAVRAMGCLEINRLPVASTSSICAAVRRSKERTKLVIVDYLQLVRTPGVQARHIEVGSISREFKLTAHELGIPFLVLCQLNRGPENEHRRPELRDLRESGCLEQDGDLVCLLWSPDRHEDIPSGRPIPAGFEYIELIVAKQRDGGTGPVELLFDKERGNIRSVGQDEEDRDRSGKAAFINGLRAAI
jgi:replicative DNA helicase